MTEKVTNIFDFPTDPQIWQGWFNHDVNRASSWILSARDLVEEMRSIATNLRTAWAEFHRRESSTQVAPPRGMHRVYLLLAAIAIENLLKAMLVGRAKWPDSQMTQKLPDDLHSHMLLELATKVALPLDDHEVDLLERLTEFGIWLGRYPAPTTLHHTKPKKLRSGTVNLVGFMYGSDIREIESLINKILNELKDVQGIEYLPDFSSRPKEEFERYTISPNVRAW